MKLVKPIRILMVLVILSTIFSCGDNTKDTINLQNGRYGGIVRVNTAEKPYSYYPPEALMNGSIKIIGLIYETMLKYEDGKVASSLIEKWEVNSSFDEYTFHLRKNVFFQNNECFSNKQGRELLASDIAYCLTNICKTNDNNNYIQLLNNIDGAKEASNDISIGSDIECLSGITSPDKYTVIIKLSSPDHNFPRLLTNPATSIYPKEALEYYAEKINSNPVGTGPFIIKADIKDKAIILERNSNYWMKDENGDQLPYLDGVKITYEQDINTLIEAARKKTFDILIDPPIKLATKIQSNTLYKINSTPSYSLSYLSIPINRKGFDNLKLRKAINYAIDRDFIIDSILSGNALKANYGIIPPVFEKYNAQNAYNFDATKAKSLLKEAGYKGNNLPKMTISTTNSSNSMSVAQAIQAMLKKNLGLISKVSALESKLHYKKYEDQKLELAYINWISDDKYPESFLNLFLGDMSIDKGGINIVKYNNPKYDEAVMNGKNETDDSKRQELFNKANKILFDDAVIIPLYSKNASSIISTKIANINNDFGMEMNFTKTYIKKDIKPKL